jgi:hypothetical protein
MKLPPPTAATVSTTTTTFHTHKEPLVGNVLQGD